MGLLRRYCQWNMKRNGWTIENARAIQQLDQSMIAVAPHTTWRDLPLGIKTRIIIRVRVRFIAKHTLFKFPFGGLMRALGGTPVNRSIKSNLVDQVVEIYRKNPSYHLCITPEGTRERVSRFRSGFYFIAKAANVPIVLTQFDYQHRKVVFSDPFWPTDDKEADFNHIYAYFDGVHGYHPEKSFYWKKAPANTDK